MARPRALELLITLPWLAAAILLLSFTRLKEPRHPWHWGLLGSIGICFSIGCLARTSVAISERAQQAAPLPANGAADAEQGRP